MSNREWLQEIIDKAKSGEYSEGTYYTRPNEQGLSIVIGWQEDYEQDDLLIQQQSGEKVWTLCGKIAYNCDDLQCDYAYDWYMPTYKGSGDIYDSEMSIADADDIVWFEDELKVATDLVKKGDLEKC